MSPGGGVIRVFAGSLAGAVSPSRHYSKTVGADVQVHGGGAVEVDLDSQYEHAVLVLAGDCSLEDQPLEQGNLYYLGTRRASASFRSRAGARVLVIGGPPFPETILMWWNFVARTPEEIVAARADWEERRRFGEVKAYRGSRLRSPDPVRFARPNPMS